MIRRPPRSTLSSSSAASDVYKRQLQDAEQVLRPVGIAEQVASVGVPRDEAQRLALAAAADQDRDVAADRLGVVEGAGGAEVLAGERRLLVGEHRARDLQRLLQTLEALLERRELEPVGGVFVLEPARADPVPRAAAGNHVERRGDLGSERRVSVGD